MPSHQVFLEALSNLETTLKEFKYWGPEVPEFNPAQISTPFGVGHISIQSWLQYIYIPKMRQIAEAGGTLPVSEVTPYAEEVLTNKVGCSEILNLLKHVDNMTSGN